MKKTICKYILARYSPDPFRDEAVNIGVVFHAPELGFVGCRFLSSFAKAKSIDPNADSKMLRDFANFWEQTFSSKKTVQLFVDEAMASQFDGHTPSEPDFLDYIASQYEGTIKFSAPRASFVSDLNAELQSLYANYVNPTVPAISRPISAGVLAPTEIRQRLFNQFVKNGLIGKNWVTPNCEVPGTVYPHHFEIGFRNGHLQVIQSLALDLPSPEQKVQRALLLAAMVNDAKLVDSTIGAEVIVKEPAEKAKAGYSESIKLLENANIEVHKLNELPQVADAVEKLMTEHHSMTDPRAAVA